MRDFHTIAEMSSWSDEQRVAGSTIAFVPTMGALHEGHLELMREGRQHSDVLVVSIYVNPAQFGPSEDLTRYPRDLEGDMTKCEAAGADAVFTPSDTMMYPDNYRTYIQVERMGGLLCGASRPTHFRGVTTVCAKLFNIVRPDVVVMGEKDYQQLVILRRMVCDLNMPLTFINVPTVREPDGLAMSSRNRYLKPAERAAALSLKRSLDRAQEMVRAGERDMRKICAEVRFTIESTHMPKVEYVSIVDPATLEDTSVLPARLCVAAVVGPARLIDNCALSAD